MAAVVVSRRQHGRRRLFQRGRRRRRKSAAGGASSGARPARSGFGESSLAAGSFLALAGRRCFGSLADWSFGSSGAGAQLARDSAPPAGGSKRPARAFSVSRRRRRRRRKSADASAVVVAVCASRRAERNGQRASIHSTSCCCSSCEPSASRSRPPRAGALARRSRRRSGFVRPPEGRHNASRRPAAGSAGSGAARPLRRRARRVRQRAPGWMDRAGSDRNGPAPAGLAPNAPVEQVALGRVSNELLPEPLGGEPSRRLPARNRHAAGSRRELSRAAEALAGRLFVSRSLGGWPGRSRVSCPLLATEPQPLRRLFARVRPGRD